MVFSFGLLLISVSVAIITNNFDCEKLPSDDLWNCEKIGYCYRDSDGKCKKDPCLAVANSNATGNNCSDGCNVATFEDNGFTVYDQCIKRYLHVCTSRTTETYNTLENRGISDCFAGMVLSNGVCNKNMFGVANGCIEVTDVFDANDGNDTFSGVTCEGDSEYDCRQLGVANCKLKNYCTLINGICIYDACHFMSESYCSNDIRCQSYTAYSHENYGAGYEIKIVDICGRKDKYGSDTTPNLCALLETTYGGYYQENPCNYWNSGDPVPADTTHCTVNSYTECGITKCVGDCNVPAPDNCTSAEGIESVTCTVETDLDGKTFCSDGRKYTQTDDGNGNGNENENDGSSAVAVRSSALLTVLLAAVLLVVVFAK